LHVRFCRCGLGLFGLGPLRTCLAALLLGLEDPFLGGLYAAQGRDYQFETLAGGAVIQPVGCFRQRSGVARGYHPVSLVYL